MRFALVTVYAATGINGSIEQHRVYYDEGGNLIWKNGRKVKGPGYFEPPNLEEFPKDDPAKTFAEEPEERCTELKPKTRTKHRA